MISATELYKGAVLNIDKELYIVVIVQHLVASGRIGAMTRVKLRNIKTGAIIEKAFKQDEKFEDVELTKKEASYLYEDGENCYFMDSETYEQFSIQKHRLGKGGNFLVAGMKVNALYEGEKFVTVELPPTVNLRIKSTAPPMRGEQSGSVEKEAILENNFKILVPLFIKENDLIKIDTLTGEYIERVQEE